MFNLFKPKSNSRGETIVEVLLATVILSTVIAGAYTLSTRATRIGQASIERTEVTNHVQSTAEVLRGIAFERGAAFSRIVSDEEETSFVTDITPVYDETFCQPTPGSRPFYIDLDNVGSTDDDPNTLFNRDVIRAYDPDDIEDDSIYNIWIEAYQQDANYIDFHIRACWQSITGPDFNRSGAVSRLYIGSGMGGFSRFASGPTRRLPLVTTDPITDIEPDSASTGGNVVDDGGSTVTARGIVYDTSPGPTLNDNHIRRGAGTGSFNVNLTNLQPETTYYVRAYATNSFGTSYGNERVFETDGDGIEATGGSEATVTIGGETYRVHIFRSNSNFRMLSDEGDVEVLIVGGGGGGGNNDAGGGGAGGVVVRSLTLSSGTYTVRVGGGGRGACCPGSTTSANRGANGQNSSFDSITARGGGGGGGRGNKGRNGASGGGGSARGKKAGGSGIAGQGHRGGKGHGHSSRPSGGGGGYASVGVNGASSRGGHGGHGFNSSSWGIGRS
ncbi:MAG: glycine-rich domain-containing protein, partial [Candidatus Saccharimonadales bacterium]